MSDRYPRMPWRRRLLILLLAVATAVTVVLTLVGPPGASKFKPPPPSEPARCAPGQQDDCVGGKASVITVPAAPASGH